MVFSVALLIQYLTVIIFLSSRERCFPIQFRHSCRNHIGVSPFGLYPHGFPCLMFGFFDLQHHRDHDHDLTFSKLRKELQSQIWDPGDSNYKTENGGLRSLIVFGSEIGLSVSPRLKTFLRLCTDVGILFHLMIFSFGIGELLLKFKTRDINLRFENVIAHSQSDEFIAPVHDNVGCEYFSSVMELCLHQFGFCWSAMSNLHVGLVKFWQQGLVCGVDIWRLKNTLATFRWESFDVRRLDIWDALVNLFVIMLEKLQSRNISKRPWYGRFWCHYVYLSGLALDTSGFMLRFVKKSFSHKLLHTNRNKEESNMKLDNNRFFDRLASKTTLRKASSNSLLLYFF